MRATKAARNNQVNLAVSPVTAYQDLCRPCDASHFHFQVHKTTKIAPTPRTTKSTTQQYPRLRTDPEIFHPVRLLTETRSARASKEEKLYETLWSIHPPPVSRTQEYRTIRANSVRTCSEKMQASLYGSPSTPLLIVENWEQPQPCLHM